MILPASSRHIWSSIKSSTTNTASGTCGHEKKKKIRIISSKRFMVTHFVDNFSWINVSLTQVSSTLLRFVATRFADMLQRHFIFFFFLLLSGIALLGLHFVRLKHVTWAGTRPHRNRQGFGKLGHHPDADVQGVVREKKFSTKWTVDETICRWNVIRRTDRHRMKSAGTPRQAQGHSWPMLRVIEGRKEWNRRQQHPQTNARTSKYYH